MININLEKCTGCGLCVKDCQKNDIIMKDNKVVPLNSTCLSCGHCIAICPQNAVSIDIYDMNEVKEYGINEFKIESEKLLNFIKYRRSIRQFKNILVEKEKIEMIIEAGRFTPTGGNRQHLSYLVIQENLQDLAKITLEVLYEYANNAELIDKDNLNLNGIKKYANVWKILKEKFENGIDELFFNAPAMIVVLSDERLSLSPVVDGAIDGSLAASNMELMANALKLGSCYNGFFSFASNDSVIRNYLKIPDNKKVVTSLLIGYSDLKYFRTVPRKKADIQWK